MNDLDELLHSALSADRVGTSLDGDVRSVLACGRHRRRRKTAIAGVAGTVAIAALAVVGFAALSPESAVRQVPATDPSLVEAPAPVVTDPAVVEPSTPDATDVAATATSTEPGSGATTTVARPDTGNTVAFVAARRDGTIELRQGDKTLAEEVAPCPVEACLIADASHVDGQIWVLTTWADATDEVAGSRIDVFDRERGTWSLVYDAPGEALDALAVGADGRAWALRRDPLLGPVLLEIGDRRATVVDDLVIGLVMGPDGAVLAYGRADPQSSFSELVVLDVASGERRRLSPVSYYPVPVEWSPDGRTLLVDDAWEGRSYGFVRPFDTPPPTASTPLHRDIDETPVEAACFVDNRTVSIARWVHPYAEGDPVAGPVEQIALDSGDVVGAATSDVLATSMACTGGGGVVVVTEQGELHRLVPGEPATVLGTDYLWVTGA